MATALPLTAAPARITARSTVRTLLAGGLVVAAGDGLDALTYFGAIRGISPLRIFQSVASGLLGRAAFDGGIPAFLLGVLLHVVVGTCVFTTYWSVSRRWPLLVRRPVACGLLFGLCAYVVMERVVIPLSAVPARGATTLPTLLNGVIGHALLVGLPAALFAARAARQRGPAFAPLVPAVG
jgi:hypothetical protein